ncbi:hypothetical protein HYZ98_03405 [Candidatus Peregrinibacteria bacterium]|nr:hypothetical protein [Candidatus Peregrinibacteria bacterium]
MSANVPSTGNTEVVMRIAMSIDAFLALQEQFIRDLAAVLSCDEDEIKIIGLYPARPETPAGFIDAAQLCELGKTKTH